MVVCSSSFWSSFFLALLLLTNGGSCDDKLLPMVINTWPFVDANWEGYINKCFLTFQLKTYYKMEGQLLMQSKKVAPNAKLNNVTAQWDTEGAPPTLSSPDEHGETTLDAMIMDGETHDVGSVGALRYVKSAISVARSVLDHTHQTLLVGDQATAFAIQMGFMNESLSTNKSTDMWKKWQSNHCQPNYWKNGTVSPDPTHNCGPYRPSNERKSNERHKKEEHSLKNKGHDTIGMVAIDAQGKIACGCTTNGLTYKIPGRVGDSPITGAGCYVEKGVGGAASTGDGDIMMRFLPSYRVVQSMKGGMSPRAAIQEALAHISEYYTYTGAMIAVNIKGEYGGAHNGKEFDGYEFTVFNPMFVNSTVVHPD